MVEKKEGALFGMYPSRKKEKKSPLTSSYTEEKFQFPDGFFF